jgi:lipoprotein-releasing system permease protein
MMIYEKMDSIAILKATGFSGKDVKWIFISLSIIIGLTGGIFGGIFGYVFSNIIDVIPFETTSLPTVKTYPLITI